MALLVLAVPLASISGAAAFLPAAVRRSSRCRTTTSMQAPQASQDYSRRRSLQVTGALAVGTSTLLLGSRLLLPAAVAAAEEQGFIFPNVSEPAFGDVCFLDFAEAGTDGKKLGRVEVSLYADIGAPKVAENFKALCAGTGGVGYKGSSVYRVLKVRGCASDAWFDLKARGAAGKGKNTTVPNLPTLPTTKPRTRRTTPSRRATSEPRSGGPAGRRASAGSPSSWRRKASGCAILWKEW